MKNGAIDFFVEPVDYDQLMAAVEFAFAEDLNKRKEQFAITAIAKQILNRVFGTELPES